MVPEGPPLLEIRNLSIRYDLGGDEIPVIQNLNLTIDRGETAVIHGKSGAGKSTILKFLLGILPHNTKLGERTSYQLNQQNMLIANDQMWRDFRKKHVACIFQNHLSALNPVKTIYWHLNRVYANAKGQKLSFLKAQNFCDKLQFADSKRILKSYPAQVSLGEAQRASIAMALIGEPHLILADEAFSSLDPKRTEKVLQLMQEPLRVIGASLLLITHDLSISQSMQAKTYQLQDGKLELLIKKDDQLSKPLLDKDFNPFTMARRKSDNEKEPIASVKNITYSFGKRRVFSKQKPVLQGVNLTFYPGESIGLIGLSGAGKSTLAKIIGNVINPLQGEIYLEDQNAEQFAKKDYYRRVQYIMQDAVSALPTRKKIERILIDTCQAYWPKQSRKWQSSKIQQILDDVDLSATILNKFPGQCSGGEKQRICIAKALIPQPKILLFDESFSSLDWETRTIILQQLKELQINQQISYLFISHDIILLKELCHKIYLLKEGKLVKIDHVNQLLEKSHIQYLFG